MDLIYLDHNATTPMRPEAVEATRRAMAENYANPASQHQAGQRARRVLEDARERIAEILGANLSSTAPDRLIFTSGGTEANNLAILGISRAGHPQQQGHIVISAVEHPSAIEPAEQLLKAGWQLDALGVDEHGVVRTERLPGLLTPRTRLVSVLLGNHDTGVVQPIATVAEICSAANVPVHTDAVQAIGKLPVDFHALAAASMSFGAHKFQGPPGIGGLLVRHGDAARTDPVWRVAAVRCSPRHGTRGSDLGDAHRAGMLAHGSSRPIGAELEKLRERFERGLQAGYPGLVVNGDSAPRLPNTSNVAFPGLDGQVLLMALDLAGVACSVGSACSSGSTELSPTLLAMGLPKSIVGSSLRFSLGATTTAAEIDEAVDRILQVCRRVARRLRGWRVCDDACLALRQQCRYIYPRRPAQLGGEHDVAKYVVVNADDLGITRSTNLAIRQAFREGIVTSASLMANMTAFQHALDHVVYQNPGLGIGIHLCLTSGKPVLPPAQVPLLVDRQGHFCRGFLGLYRLVRSRQGPRGGRPDCRGAKCPGRAVRPLRHRRRPRGRASARADDSARFSRLRPRSPRRGMPRCGFRTSISALRIAGRSLAPLSEQRRPGQENDPQPAFAKRHGSGSSTWSTPTVTTACWKRAGLPAQILWEILRCAARRGDRNQLPPAVGRRLWIGRSFAASPIGGS